MYNLLYMYVQLHIVPFYMIVYTVYLHIHLHIRVHVLVQCTYMFVFIFRTMCKRGGGGGGGVEGYKSRGCVKKAKYSILRLSFRTNDTEISVSRLEGHVK